MKRLNTIRVPPVEKHPLSKVEVPDYLTYVEIRAYEQYPARTVFWRQGQGMFGRWSIDANGSSVGQMTIDTTEFAVQATDAEILECELVGEPA